MASHEATRRSRTRPASEPRVLIAVEPPSLRRLLGHLLEGQSGLEVMARAPRSAPGLLKAARLAPDVIIVNHRVNPRAPRKERFAFLASLKRFSPASTLIFLAHSFYLSARHEAVDLCLPEDAVVSGLLPMIRKANRSAAHRASTPVPSGPRT